VTEIHDTGGLAITTMKDSAWLVMSSFGLRFGERKSEAQAERRTEPELNDRRGTQAESPPILRRANYRS